MEEHWLSTQLGMVLEVFNKIRANETLILEAVQAADPKAHRSNYPNVNVKNMMLLTGRFEAILSHLPELQLLTRMQRQELVAANFPQAHLVCFSR